MRAGVLLVRRLELGLCFDADNGTDAVVTGRAAPPRTVAVVRWRSPRAFEVSPGGGAGGSQALWEAPNGAESGDGRKRIRGSVSISVAARGLNHFDFRAAAWTFPQERHRGKFCQVNTGFVFLTTNILGRLMGTTLVFG